MISDVRADYIHNTLALLKKENPDIDIDVVYKKIEAGCSSNVEE